MVRDRNESKIIDKGKALILPTTAMRDKVAKFAIEFTIGLSCAMLGTLLYIWINKLFIFP